MLRLAVRDKLSRCDRPMKAIVLEQYGRPEVLSMVDVPEPDVGPDDVLIRVRATALNRADLLERRGLYPPPEPRPRHQIPGLECAGEVVAIGPRVRRWRPGDRVMALLAYGGYAQYASVHELLAMPVPAEWSWAQAAAVPEVFLTAYDALFERARLRSGSRVLIHAGASGVGLAAIQIARAAGIKVATTVSTATKADIVRQMGADLVVRYREEQFLDAVRAWTNGQGVDAILDLVGQAYFRDNLETLATGGRLVVVGTLSGQDVTVPLGMILARRLSIVGTALRARRIDEKIALVQAFEHHMGPLFHEHVLKPVVDRVFRLEQAAQAHAYMESNRHIGKIILTID